MPTPVHAARQCLTQEATTVLDEAVAVARRRGHGQTTSLHMISSLLSLPNSCLREACTRTRNNAYSTRVQFKALELSLSVSLDRLPSSQAAKVEEPPVSNSLMAAVKRSQANQRRQPENFTFYQQQQQQYSSSCSSVPVVKVELQNLVLSILDDPSVSRVFGEAGFRSCDIKLATLRPGNSFHAHQVFGYMSRYSKRPTPPPMFLYSDSTNTNDVGLGGKGFRFPFMGCFSGDENSIKIGEVMVRDKKRNPLLLGVSANDALRSFLETVERKVRGVLPEELNGLSVVCIKDEVLRFVNGDCDEGVLRLRFEEVERVLENVVGGGGVVVNIGDFQGLGGDGVGFDGLRYLVREFGRLMAIHGGKLWVIGAAATYEIYFKILNKFPSIEEDLDLEIFPITSLRFSVGGSYPRSSLMDSFVPLGGFFSMPPETKSPLSNTSEYVVRCHLCNEKYEQEVVALSKGGLSASVVQQYHASLPSWLQIAEPGTQTGSAPIKGKDDRLLLNAKIKGLQNKWNGICHQHHYNQTFSKGYTDQLGYPFPRVLGFQVSEDRRENPSNDGNNHSNESSTEPGNKNVTCTLSTDLQHSPSSEGFRSLDMLSKAHNLSLLSKSGEIPSESKGINDRHTSPTSVTSVTTDLGLGIISEKLSKSSSCDNHTHSMVNDPKLLYKALLERVGQQEEAISSVIQAITRTGLHGVNRSDIWMNFRGPDRLGKRKIGAVLAEILYGSTESFIYADLSFQEELVHTDVILNSRETNKYDLTMRGTVVDYLVEKLSKKPCVVFLENIDKADLVVQNSLSLAVKTGRFADLRGREVNISNSIFIGTTTRSIEGGQSHEESSKYLEEDILKVKGSLIQILIRFDLNDDLMSENKKQLSDSTLMNKRKLMGQRRRTDECGSLEIAKRAHKASNSYLNLNLPAEGSEICNTYSEESDSSDSNSENQWLEDFESQIDQIIVFNQFDFDTLAEKQFKEISQCLHKIVGSECSLEMEPKVMKQLIAAEYLFGNNRVENWIECVLKQGFVEAMGKFGLNALSIVKLVTCEGTISEVPPKSFLLPAKIIMN